MSHNTQRPTWPDRAILGALVVFTLLAVAGYASFGRHPALVARVPGAVAPYGLAMRVFPLGHVWLAFGVIALYLTRHTDARWLPAFGLLYVLSLASELLGTGYGIPFGVYHYSALLGPEWMNRVPVLIPLSWFSVAVASYGIATLGRSAGQSRTRMRVGFASLLLLCWDLSLDPAMSHATMFWVWGAQGPYYGMPWSNLAGWYITGVVLATTLALVGADTWMLSLSPRWLRGFYGANLLLALGMDIAANLWLAVVVTAVALSVTLIALTRVDQRFTPGERASRPRPRLTSI
ncbi:MAG: carotenoid biosynthesis protein [Gemmatimonadaceae bacterium]